MMTKTGVLTPVLILWVFLLVAATATRAVVDGIVKAVRNPGRGRTLIVEVGTPEAGPRGGAA
jgi:hypothetical protein